MKNVRAFLLISLGLFLSLPALTRTCSAQTATVTFYSFRVTAKDALKDSFATKGTMPFAGWIYDGNLPIADMVQDRFLSIEVPSGPHVFSGGYNPKNATRNPELQINIQEGHSYCIRLNQRFTSSPFLPVMHTHAQIADVSCQQALKEVRNTKPLEVKRVQTRYRGMLLHWSSFPDAKHTRTSDGVAR
jgi:hypothetical protein